MKLTKLFIVLGILCAVAVFTLDRVQMNCFHCVKVYQFNVLVIPLVLISFIMLVAGLIRLLSGQRVKPSTVQKNAACDADQPDA